MKMTKYQKRAAKHNLTAHTTNNLLHLLCGLTEEVGEIHSIIKRFARGDTQEISHVNLASEIGDVLWYLSQLCEHFDLDLESVAEANLHKLEDRHLRNVLKGSGDKR